MRETLNYRPRPRSLAIIVFGLIYFHTTAAQLPERDLHKMIGTHAWSREQVNALENGEIVVRSLETEGNQDIASIMQSKSALSGKP